MSWKVDTQHGDVKIFDDSGKVRGRYRDADTALVHLALALQEIDRITSLNRFLKQQTNPTFR